MVDRTRILYVEHNVDGTIGGSYYSLLGLVSSIDRSRYEPIVVFYRDHDLVRKYEAAGARVILVQPPRAFDFRAKLGEWAGGAWLGWLLLPLQRALNVWRRVVITAWRHSRFLRSERIGLVHLNNSVLHNHDWMLAARLVGVPCVTHERGINDNFPPIARWMARRLAAVISISGAVTRNFAKQGLQYSNIVTIHNGVDPERLRVQRSAEELRTEFGIARNAPVIGVVGNIKTWKGQEVVLRATGLVRSEFPEIRCLVVGETGEVDYVTKLERLVRELAIEDNVVFTGYQPHVPDFMNAMDIVVHSSVEPEPFGIVLLEAMGLAKPVVATNIGAPPEIIEDGQSGYLVPPGDARALANRVLTLLEDAELRTRIGQAAHARMAAEFTIARTAGRVQAVYDRILWGTQSTCAGGEGG